jgi:hypothetical protein
MNVMAVCINLLGVPRAAGIALIEFSYSAERSGLSILQFERSAAVALVALHTHRPCRIPVRLRGTLLLILVPVNPRETGRGVLHAKRHRSRKRAV